MTVGVGEMKEMTPSWKVNIKYYCVRDVNYIIIQFILLLWTFLRRMTLQKLDTALQDDQSFLIRAECLPLTSFPLSCSLSITSEGMAFLYC